MKTSTPLLFMGLLFLGASTTLLGIQYLGHMEERTTHRHDSLAAEMDKMRQHLEAQDGDLGNLVRSMRDDEVKARKQLAAAAAEAHSRLGSGEDLDTAVSDMRGRLRVLEDERQRLAGHLRGLRRVIALGGGLAVDTRDSKKNSGKSRGAVVKSKHTVVPFFLRARRRRAKKEDSSSSSSSRDDRGDGDDDQVAITTHLEPSALVELRRLAAAWRGPVSAALYLCDDRSRASFARWLEEEEEEEKDEEGRGQGNGGAVAEFVDLHVVTCRKGAAGGDDGALSTGGGGSAVPGTTVPANLLRNVAVEHARSLYVVDLDVGMVPSKGASWAIGHAASRLLGRDGSGGNTRRVGKTSSAASSGGRADATSLVKAALVLPVFEYAGAAATPGAAKMPVTKTELLKTRTAGQVRPLHESFAYAGGPTDYDKWYGGSTNEVVVKYGYLYEPFVVTSRAAARQLVPFRADFIGASQPGRAARAYELAAAGFAFHVVADAFAVCSSSLGGSGSTGSGDCPRHWRAATVAPPAIGSSDDREDDDDDDDDDNMAADAGADLAAALATWWRFVEGVYERYEFRVPLPRWLTDWLKDAPCWGFPPASTSGVSKAQQQVFANLPYDRCPGSGSGGSDKTSPSSMSAY